jgi:tRNA modification GTPase
VSEIAGTTRDTIEETLTLSGITYRFIDTAGIRKDTQDSIEKIGIQKTIDSIDKAKVLLYVFDVNTTTPAQVQQDIADYAQTDVKLLLIGNKKDLLSDAAILNIQETLQILLPKATFLAVSAKQKEAIETIKTALSSFFTHGDSQADQSIVSNIRHFDALSKALVCIEKVEAGIAQNISSDFLAMDIRQSLYHIGEITGEVDVDIDILGTIFSKFCIGK